MLFKKQSALLGFGHGQLAQQFAQLFHVGIGQIGGKLGVLVVDFQGNQAVLARDGFGIPSQCGAGIGFELGLVTLLGLRQHRFNVT